MTPITRLPFIYTLLFFYFSSPGTKLHCHQKIAVPLAASKSKDRDAENIAYRLTGTEKGEVHLKSEGSNVPIIPDTPLFSGTLGYIWIEAILPVCS